MAELVKKLHFKKSGTDQIAKAYSTMAEAGADYITNKIDGLTAYVSIGATSDNRATTGRVTKGSTKAILSSGKPPYNKVEYRTPGTYTVTIPLGVVTIRTQTAGAGGGGAGNEWYSGGESDPDTIVPGGNGGNGELITKNISVTPLLTLTIIVGSGGAGGSYWGKSGGGGGISSIVNVVTARGGGGGLKDNRNGVSYGDGGAGGRGGKRTDRAESGQAGSPGWVIIEYGGDI